MSILTKFQTSSDHRDIGFRQATSQDYQLYQILLKPTLPPRFVRKSVMSYLYCVWTLSELQHPTRIWSFNSSLNPQNISEINSSRFVGVTRFLVCFVFSWIFWIFFEKCDFLQKSGFVSGFLTEIHVSIYPQKIIFAN